MKNDTENKQNEKKEKGILIALLCSIIIILGMALYICYDKGILFSSSNKSKDTQNNVTEKEEDSNETVKEKKLVETLFSLSSNKEVFLENANNSMKILDYSDSEDGFLNSVNILVLNISLTLLVSIVVS